MTDEEYQACQLMSPWLCAHLGKAALMNSLVTSVCNYFSCHCHGLLTALFVLLKCWWDYVCWWVGWLNMLLFICLSIYPSIIVVHRV